MLKKLLHIRYNHSKMTSIVGFFSRITNYKQLVIEVSPETYERAQKWNAKRWESDSGKHYLQLNLDRYDKNIIDSKFEPLLRSKVSIKAENKQFTTEEGTTVKYMLVKQIWKCKVQTGVAEHSSASQVEEKTDIEKQFDAIEDEEEETAQPVAPPRRRKGIV